MRKFPLFFLLALSITHMLAQNNHQEELPYHQIPEAPESYHAGNILSRFIDGLGYRYYWATEGLTESDLKFSPSEEARTTYQTLEHLFGLSEMIVNAPQNKSNVRPTDWPDMTYEDLRKQTLLNLQQASELCAGKTESEISEFSIIFQRGDNKNAFPYWNMMNGPISDAIYHVGQVVSFRRASGNPINPKVNVFIGKTRN